MLESKDPHQDRLGALAIAAAIGVIAVCAIAASLRRFVRTGRHELEREAELDGWAYSGLS